jgi:hypothetical protein
VYLDDDNGIGHTTTFPNKSASVSANFISYLDWSGLAGPYAQHTQTRAMVLLGREVWKDIRGEYWKTGTEKAYTNARAHNIFAFLVAAKEPARSDRAGGVGNFIVE